MICTRLLILGHVRLTTLSYTLEFILSLLLPAKDKCWQNLTTTFERQQMCLANKMINFSKGTTDKIVEIYPRLKYPTISHIRATVSQCHTDVQENVYSSPNTVLLMSHEKLAQVYYAGLFEAVHHKQTRHQDTARSYDIICHKLVYLALRLYLRFCPHV